MNPHHPPHANRHPPMHHPEYYPHNPHYRPYYYDPHRYYSGWYPTYRPIYPWWIDAAEFGAGFVLGRVSANRGLYYYYPSSEYYSGEYYYPYGGTTVNETTVIIQGDNQYLDGAEELPQDDGILQELRVDDSLTEAQGRPHSILNQDLDLTNANDSDLNPEEDGMILTEQEAAELPKITKESVDTAWENIQAADTLFAQGKIQEAKQKYTEVTESLGLIPDPWFRLAYLEAALNNYEKGAEHIHRGMELSRNWPSSPFSLDYMYQGADDRKTANLAALEAAAKNAPSSADFNLLAGLSFYSDGQTDKAAIYLEKAKKIAPDWKEFVDPMLKNIREDGITKDK